VDDAETAAAVTTAGTTFVGPWSAQAAGDYATGSNHVLPTNGAARFRGGLHAADFVRVSTVQRMTRQGLDNLASTVVTLAREEGLEAHARSIEIRLGAGRRASTQSLPSVQRARGTGRGGGAPRQTKK
jgi:histidinol dehydrogenase